MKSSQIIATLIAVLALAWIVSGLFGTNAKDEQTGETSIQEQNEQTENALIDVRVSTQNAEPYTNHITVTGRTRPSRTVELKAEIEGQVADILKSEGETVSENDSLATLELKDRKARVSEAQELVNQRQIQYNAAKELAEKGFSSKVSLAQAAADLENARAILAATQSDLQKINIKAPYDGIINAQMIETGDYLSAGDPAFTIVDLDPLEIEAYLSERQIADIQQGAIARATSLQGDTLDGTVSFIAAAADQETRTFRIVITLNNPDYKIKGGLTTQLAIPTPQREAHKISPSILTLNTAGKIGVKIVTEDNKVAFLPVEILSDNTEHMWIGGLPDRVRLITVGQEFVKDGQTVNPVESETQVPGTENSRESEESGAP